MVDLKELEKKYSNNKTSSDLTESLSLKSGFTAMGKSLGRMFGGSKRVKGSISKFQISLKDEEQEKKLIDSRIS